jgi:hypothetical protein
MKNKEKDPNVEYFQELDKLILNAKPIGGILSLGWPNNILNFKENSTFNKHVQKFMQGDESKEDVFNNLCEIFILNKNIQKLINHVLKEIPRLQTFLGVNGNMAQEYTYNIKAMKHITEKFQVNEKEKENLRNRYNLEFNKTILHTLKLEANIS